MLFQILHRGASMLEVQSKLLNPGGSLLVGELEVGDEEHGHTLRVLNQGYMEKIGANIVRAVDSDGNPTAEPVLLKSDGTRLATDGDPHFIEFQPYRATNWSPLGTL
jgi:hypothetical protein